jgi:hypothetical protein
MEAGETRPPVFEGKLIMVVESKILELLDYAEQVGFQRSDFIVVKQTALQTVFNPNWYFTIQEDGYRFKLTFTPGASHTTEIHFSLNWTKSEASGGAYYESIRYYFNCWLRNVSNERAAVQAPGESAPAWAAAALPERAIRLRTEIGEKTSRARPF